MLLMLFSLFPVFADVAPGPVFAVVVLLPVLIIAVLAVCIALCIRHFVRKKKQK